MIITLSSIELSSSRFRGLLERHEIATIVISGSRLQGTFHRPIETKPGKAMTRFTSRLPTLENTEFSGC